MKNLNGELPAYPLSKDHVDGRDYRGLTKREYFAAMAMQGYCGGEYIGQSGVPHDAIAKWSIEMADELLKQLES